MTEAVSEEQTRIKLGSWEIDGSILRPLRCQLQQYAIRLAHQSLDDPAITFRLKPSNKTVSFHQSNIRAVGGPLAVFISGSFVESSFGEITLHDEDYEAFSIIRNFLYMEPINMAIVPHELVYAADRWELDTLFRACFAWAEKSTVSHWEFLCRWIPVMNRIHVPPRFKEFIAMKFALSVAQNPESFRWLTSHGFYGNIHVLHALIKSGSFPLVECCCESCTLCLCGDCPDCVHRSSRAPKRLRKSNMSLEATPLSGICPQDNNSPTITRHHLYTTTANSNALPGSWDPLMGVREVQLRLLPLRFNSSHFVKENCWHDDPKAGPTNITMPPEYNTHANCDDQKCAIDKLQSDSIWRVFHFQHMLPLVIRYLQRFATEDPILMLLDVICKQLEPELTDIQLRNFLDSLECARDSFETVHRHQMTYTWSRRASRAFEEMVSSSRSVAQYQSRFCLVWHVGGLKQKAEIPVDSFSVLSEPVVWHGSCFEMTLRCSDTYSTEGAPLNLTLSQKAPWSLLLGLDSLTIEANIWFVEDGCRCELRKFRNVGDMEGGRGFMSRLFNVKRNISLLRQDGLNFTVMDRFAFRSWLKCHRSECSLVIGIQMMFIADDANGDNGGTDLEREGNTAESDINENNVGECGMNSKCTPNCQECETDVYNSEYHWYSEEEEYVFEEAENIGYPVGPEDGDEFEAAMEAFYFE